MTPAEVLNEINKMPLVEKQKLLEKLTRELKSVEEIDLEAEEKSFLAALHSKGLLEELPLKASDDQIRQSFKRLEISGDPLSETIIKERG